MLVYSSEKFNPKRNGHGYEYYSRDGICGECGSVIGTLECYNYNKEPREYSFYNREKNSYEFCPYCGEPLKKKEK